MNKDDVARELEALKELPRGWDGYNAEPIDREIIAAAHEVLGAIDADAPEPRVVPMTRGRLQFEFNVNGRELELEVETPNKIHFLWCDADSDEEDEISIDDHDEVRRLVRRMTD